MNIISIVKSVERGLMDAISMVRWAIGRERVRCGERVREPARPYFFDNTTNPS